MRLSSSSSSSSPSPSSSTMLSVYPQLVQHQHQDRQPLHHIHHHQGFPVYGSPPLRTMPHRESSSPILSRPSSMGGVSPQPAKSPQDAAVAQALEIARESPDGASDATISKILEHALASVWDKVEAQPDSYIMTRDEFAVFNFFQHRFVDNKVAVSARRRYWDNARA